MKYTSTSCIERCDISTLIRANAAFRSTCPKRNRLQSNLRVCFAQGNNKEDSGDLDRQLLEDLERLQQRQSLQGPQQGQLGGGRAAGYQSSSNSGNSMETNAQGGVLKDLVDKVLIADFFFILFALAWFAVGVVQQSTGSSALLDSWYSLWQWVFQPAIGVLMLGALSSGLINWVSDNMQKK